MSGEPDQQAAHEPQEPTDVRPGEMRLHPDRPPVTRLSRKVLTGLGGIAALGMAGALFFALRPQEPKAPPRELLNTGPQSLPDGLFRLQKSHLADAPKLGPPLPGDLGKPMHDAGVMPGGMPAATAQTPEQQRLAQEQEAARTSHLFATTSTAGPVTPNAAMATVPLAQPSPMLQSAADPTGTENMQDRKLAFLKDGAAGSGVSPARIERPASPYVVQAGWVIQGALVTAIDSDLPGDIIGQVTENIFDSPLGRYLLIPAGAKIFGKFSSQISFGQRRVQIVWTRITFPDGSWVALQNLPGADTAGYSGLEDEVDNHWGSLFKAAVLSTVLSVGAEAGTSDSENNLAQAIRQGASQSINQTGQQIVERNLNIQPTLTIRPGFPIRVIVDRDLLLAPYPHAVAQ